MSTEEGSLLGGELDAEGPQLADRVLQRHRGRIRRLAGRLAFQLAIRAFEHREGLVTGFSKKYGCKTLVWYEMHETMMEAITREKQIKAGSRAKKLALIDALNPAKR